MDTIANNEKKSPSNNILIFFKNVFFAFLSIFTYAYKGVKACTFDLFVFLYNSISWRLDKAYRRTRESVNFDDYDQDKGKQKKEKIYKYSKRTMAKLEKEYNELVNDLQTTGATRTKEPNIYLYKVQESNGKIVTGTMSGSSKLDINSFLVNEGYKVYSIKTNKYINFLYKDSVFGGSRLSVKDLIFWLTQLSTYLKSGITLNDSIRILAKQMSKKPSRAKAFKKISYELILGSSFSTALEKQGNMFPALLINMIKAAEASGTLIETLDDMANYYTEIDNTRKEMKSAMMYPMIVSLFSVGVIIFILSYVIPQFVEIYEKNDIKIAGVTKAVIGASTYLKNNYISIGLILILGVLLFTISYKKVKVFRKNVQKLLMHIPVIKDLIIYQELTIFTKTFASLLKNNVFITDSIEILSKITNNEIYKGILYRTINNIVKGEKISEAFKDHWAVPEVAYYMIVTGESTGELDKMMQKVSEYYQGLHKSTVNNLKAFIEPVLIALLALIVGIIIISVVVPMFSLYDEVLK